MGNDLNLKQSFTIDKRMSEVSDHAALAMRAVMPSRPGALPGKVFHIADLSSSMEQGVISPKSSVGGGMAKSESQFGISDLRRNSTVSCIDCEALLFSSTMELIITLGVDPFLSHLYKEPQGMAPVSVACLRQVSFLALLRADMNKFRALVYSAV